MKKPPTIDLRLMEDRAKFGKVAPGNRIQKDGWVFVVSINRCRAEPACPLWLYDDLMAAAKRKAKNNSTFVRDVAADAGQILGNVRHMTWFIEAVAVEMASTTEKWSKALPAFITPE